MISQQQLQQLAKTLKGELFFDNLHKVMYATDASVYRKLPLAVAYPKTHTDLQQLIQFAKQHKTSLIPRAAGTSLAGQCVGEGIVVDVSKHFTQIISLSESKKQITVQPGVIRDELNAYVKPHGLFFGPNTSTANRCMIGGMVGNNSSGTTSIQYGVTRDKVVQLKCILSDGATVVFKDLSDAEFQQKLKLQTLEGDIYRFLYQELSKPAIQQEIRKEFPKSEIHRRNTGYAIDELLKSSIFTTDTKAFNLSNLLSGSEGTLAFITEITLQLDALPPQYSIMVASHYNSVTDCLNDVEHAMKHQLYTCEMMDKTILDCTKNNTTQQKNRFFIVDDPQAILMLEVRAEALKEAEEKASKLVATLQEQGLSYANVLLHGEEINQAFTLRKAGLGLLGNIIGDKKAVACIEDTAVALPDLSSFIAEFTQLMQKYNQKAVYYAHAGAGELHLRPILNLKKKEDVVLFRKITTDVAYLTKKYKGSFSGEHGDGIVRAEFIPLMIGEKNYELCKRLKQVFDSENIFNPGKIVNPYKMDENLRYTPNRIEPKVKTLLDFSDNQGILRAVEKCNGSGDCRKPISAGGAMCPSYRATKNEKDVTRARANVLREFLTQSPKNNKFNHQEIKESLSLCLSCKACASECPSSVDIAAYKAEFLYQYQQTNGYKLKDKLVAYNTKINKWMMPFSGVTNAIFSNNVTASIIKKISGVHPKRTLPNLAKKSFAKSYQKQSMTNPIQTVYLFVDEFCNYQDVQVAKAAYELLTRLHYQVEVITHLESARTFLSKGFLKQAQEIANKNVAYLQDKVSASTPLIGIEPSAILSFRDEYKRLVFNKKAIQNIAENTFLIEEFLAAEIKKGNIKSAQFTTEAKTIKIHNHCHQKALSNQKVTFTILNLPKNYNPTIIPSGCCGMAGSFGYEKDKYKVSMQIGNQTLFPAINKADNNTIIVANGTSCRHQIKDGTQRTAYHPVEILVKALI